MSIAFIPSDVVVIQVFLQTMKLGTDAEIAQVEVEISELRLQHQRIGAALVTAEERKADLTVYTAPIHWLHKEILLEIFKLVVESDFDDSHSSTQLHPSGSPAILLSQIARRWRGVINNIPSFWNAFRIGLTSSLDLISAHLERSRDLPLRIKMIQTRRYNGGVGRADFTPALSLLKSRSQYLDHLRIFANDESFWYDVIQEFCEAYCPLLRSLVMCRKNTYALGCTLFTQGTPLLSSVYLHGFVIGAFPPGPALRAVHFETDNWGDPDNMYAADLVVQAPLLESLTLVQLNPRFWDPIGPFMFPVLKKLCLSQFPGDEVNARCSQLLTPSLETLVIARTQFATSAELGSIFRDHGTTPYPRLRSLSLAKIHLGSPITEATLASLSSIEHLLLDTDHVDSFLDLLKTQALTPGTAMLLPRLHTLELVPGSFTNDRLSAMISARLAMNYSVIVEVQSVDSIQSLLDDTFSPEY